MSTTIESDWECERLKEQLSAANAEIERLELRIRLAEGNVKRNQETTRIVMEKLAVYQLREKVLLEGLKFMFVLSAGLINKYTDETLPDDVRKLALDLSCEIEGADELTTIEKIRESVQALSQPVDAAMKGE